MNAITMEQAAHYDAIFARTATAVAVEMTAVAQERAHSSGNRLVAMSAFAIAGAIGVGVFGANSGESEAMNTVPASAEAAVASTASTEASTTTAAETTTTTEAPTIITISEAKADRIENKIEQLTDDEVTYIYTNIVTGNQASKEVGKIEISTSDAEQSRDNFYWDLRHNPQTLAFYATCLDQDTPNYENCAEDSDEEGIKVLEDAGKLLVEINAMELREKAVLAEETIAKFELMEFEGVEEHNGTYATMRLKLENGKVVGFEQSTHASRANDPRLHFTYVDEDGNTQEIVVRGCAQITKELPPETPTPTTTPQTTTPPTTHETTTTPTTVPETTTIPETTTTTTIPETTTSTTTTTTTTIPETTTTTTIPETTTTTTTTIPETTTTTTIPETTTTRPEVPVPVSSVPIGGPGSGGEPDSDDDPNNNVTTSTTSVTTTVPTSSTVPPITAPPNQTSTSLAPVYVP